MGGKNEKYFKVVEGQATNNGEVVRIKKVISKKPRSTIGVRSTLILLCKYLPEDFDEVFVSAIKVIYG